VLFLNFEIREAYWQWRLNQVARAKDIQFERGQLKLLNLRGFGADFRSLIPQVIQRASHEQFDVIVFDPLYKIYGPGSDENSTGDMAELMNGLERITVQTGSAIAYGAHFSKGNQSQKNAIDRISGSGVYGRDPDALLIFTEHDEPNALTVEAILRDFPPRDPFVVRWQFPLMHPAHDLDPAKLKNAAGRKKAHDPKKLLAAIADTTAEKPVSISAWALAANVPRNTLADYLPEMRSHQWIKTTGEGNVARQYITREGKSFLQQNQPAENQSAQVSLTF
jgi:predicted transcriptional regulator